MVEFSSDDPAEVADRIETTRRRLARSQRPDRGWCRPLTRPARTAMELAQRSHAAAIRHARRSQAGDVRRGLCRRRPHICRSSSRASGRCCNSHGTDGAFYGHASVGCLHIRPALKPERLRRRGPHAAHHRGSHGPGTGIWRIAQRRAWRWPGAERVERKMFGPAIYQAFRRGQAGVRSATLLNPGKVVNAPPMTENLRYGPPYARSNRQLFSITASRRVRTFRRDCATATALAARCRAARCALLYRATRDEKDTTRGRANALRLALSGGAWEVDAASLARNREVHEVLDLCLMCKACKAECPSNVDVAKLKAELLQFYLPGPPASARASARWSAVHRLNRLGAPLAPLVNWLQTRRPLRWLLEKDGRR